MIIDNAFLELILKDSQLNTAQENILSLKEKDYTKVLNKDISLEQAALLILLRGTFSKETQEQIQKNYFSIKTFKEELSKTKTIKKNKTTVQNNSLTIYCDGACSNNPGEAGSGLALYYDENAPILLYGQYHSMGTNNTAELNALYKALLLAQESQASRITIYSDSKYSIDCISKWAYSWKSKNWTKKTGEIKNLEIIKLAHNLYDEIENKISLKHVKAHAGTQGNELADRMAGYTIDAKNTDYKQYDYEDINIPLSLKRD
ncbi:MAG: reverse transcriptase-like protein [Campylobacteraceae bacterium]|nr:reverse transcriptase-like protein [Campylobacteraceae bacterium]